MQRNRFEMLSLSNINYILLQHYLFVRRLNRTSCWLLRFLYWYFAMKLWILSSMIKKSREYVFCYLRYEHLNFIKLKKMPWVKNTHWNIQTNTESLFFYFKKIIKVWIKSCNPLTLWNIHLLRKLVIVSSLLIDMRKSLFL